MYKVTLLISLIILSNTCLAQCHKAFQSYLNHWRVENNITGVVISSQAKNGKIVDYTSGFQIEHKSHTTPISSKNLFGVGSITKTFIAAAILQLQQRHKLNINDKIGKYFPQYPRWKNITIKELLNMTSGITNYILLPAYKKYLNSYLNNKPQKALSPYVFINSAYQSKDRFRPGSKWQYSNTNYLILGQIIEKVTKQQISNVLSHWFFKPLQLDHTHYSTSFYPSKVTRLMAHGYYGKRDIYHFNASLFNSAGAVVMNSHDLLKWARALFTPGKVLSEASIKQLQTTTSIPIGNAVARGTQYGLAIYSYHVPGVGKIWYYLGAIVGYSSMFIWVPSQDRVVAIQVSSWPRYYNQIFVPSAIAPPSTLMKKVLSKQL